MTSILGIDLGTTSVKCTIVKHGKIVASNQLRHYADVKFEDSSLYNEQNPKAIINALDNCLQLIRVNLKCVEKIFVTGQMHGVVLWKSTVQTSVKKYSTVTEILEHTVSKISNLITWQDQRCDAEFLKSLPKRSSHSNLRTGFGIASMIWLDRNDHETLLEYDLCGSIMDFIVWLLTRNGPVHMTPQVANSWGYFNVKKNQWETELLQEIRLSNNLKLPSICSSSDNFVLRENLYGLCSDDVKVFPALGDMQCSIVATHPKPNEAILNIGTSAQLSFIVSKDEEFDISNYPALSIVPFTHDHYIVTAASLNGGNVVSELASFLHSCVSPFVDNLHHDAIYEMIEKKASSKMNSINKSELMFKPTFYGERFESSLTACITNIKANNFNIEHLCYATYKGLIENIENMLPKELLRGLGKDSIVCAGSVLCNSGVLQQLVGEIFQMNIRVVDNDTGDASFGATIFNECQY